MAQQSQTGKMIMVVVLAAVLGVVLLVRSGILPTGSDSKDGSTTPAPAGKTGQTPAVAPAAQGTTGKIATRWKRPDPVGPIARDPTRMDVSRAAVRSKETATTSTEPEYTVVGIVFNAEQPSAVIIDGQVLHEGDTIHDAIVTKIAEGYAELSRGDQKWTVRPGERYRGSQVARPQN